MKYEWRSKLRTLNLPRTGWTAGVFTLLILLPFWWAGTRWYQQRVETEMRAEVAAELTLRSNTLSASLNRRLALIDGLVAYVLAVEEGEDYATSFAIYARSIYQSAPGIRNVAIAPSGVVNYVYPVINNQRVIGYDPRLDPRPGVRLDVQRAIDGRVRVLSGPIELDQGGIGLIARQAIYKENIYWGLVNLVFELEPILIRSGFDTLPSRLEIALVDEDHNLIIGSPEVLEREPVQQTINLADESWILAAIPSEGWSSGVALNLRVFQFTTMSSLLLLGILVSVTSGRQQALAEAVEVRTRELFALTQRLEEDITQRKAAEAALREREAQYRSVYNSVSDGILVISLNHELIDFNPSAAGMLGYTEAEFRTQQPTTFLHPASRPLLNAYLNQATQGNAFRIHATAERKDTSQFPVELTGSQFVYQSDPHILLLIRDISSQVQSYQQLEERVAARTSELAALLEVSQQIGATLELAPLLDLMLGQLQKVVAYTGAAFILNQDGHYQYMAYQGPGPRAAICARILPAGQVSGAQAVLEQEKPVVYPNLWDATPEGDYLRSDPELREAFSYAKAWLGIPLIVRDRKVGVLRLDHASAGFFEDRHARLAQAFAQQAAIAIENARLYEQAGTLAALEERQRLARELHDSVSQALYGIALGARTAHALLDRNETRIPTLKEPLEYVLSLAEAALMEMRALIFELRPESLSNEGLVGMINHQVNALQVRHQIVISSKLIPEPDLPLKLKEALFRIVQEGMHNIIKHAQATEISLEFSQAPDGYHIIIQDNGIGFNPQQSFPGHFGLKSMRERLAQFEGGLEIESQPGRGTRLHIYFPQG